MRTDRLLALADAIEHSSVSPTLGFNMSWGSLESSEGQYDTSGRGCGTVACIAGHANVMFSLNLSEDDFESSDRAEALLELTPEQGRALFLPMLNMGGPVTPREPVPGGTDWYSVTPAQAATVVRGLAETGVIDWPSALGMGAH